MKKIFILTLFTLTLVSFNAPLVFSQCNTAPCTVPIPQVNAQDACILSAPSMLYGYFGATTMETPVSFPPAWCVTIENNHFFAFTADDTTAAFSISVTNCIAGDSLQAAILSTSDCINFEFVSPCLCCIGAQSSQNLVATNLIPGNNYYLTIDGRAGALCDYEINEMITSDVTTVSASKTNIQILPNPFQNYISIVSGLELDHAQLIVYNMLGQEAIRIENISGRDVSLQMENLEKGIYLAVLQQSGKLLKKTAIVAE